jgi:cytoskeletal protein CcmA (bactofilin family)
MAVKYLSNKVKDLQVGIKNYSENRGSSLYVVGNVGVGTNDATAEVGISNTSILAVGILTAYKIFSSVYGEFTGAFSGGTVDANSLNVSGISTLGNVKVSGGIVTATTGVVTYYGDGQYLTGIDVENPSQLNVAGVSTFSGNIDANSNVDIAGTLDVDGQTSLDDLLVTGVSTFNNTVTLSSLLDCNGGADINTLTAATAKISDLTDTRIVIAGTNGELEDSAQLRYISSTLTVGTNLDVDGHTELDDVNVSGASTFSSLIDVNAGANIAGGLVANSASISDLTNGRLVYAGANGELQDSSSLTFTGNLLQIQNSALDVTGHTELDNLNVSGISTFGEDVVFTGQNTNARWSKSSSDLTFFNNTRLVFGSNVDLQIWHGGSHTFMKNTGGDLRIRSDVLKLAREDGSEPYLEANVNNEVKLFFNGNEKFATTLDGVNITGHVETDTINVTGLSTFVGDAVFNGNVSIAGTLTKEDVTNIDSVGLITARSGVRITGGGLTAVGVATFTGAIDADGGANISGGTGLTASSAKISDLTINRVVTVGASGELQDSANLGYDGTKLTTNGLTVNGNILAPNAGNFVAIGTASALGAGTDRLALLGSSTDSGVRIWASSAAHKATSVPLQVADYSGTELFRVHGDGNVGISSAIPSEKLDVDGNIKVSGNVTASSFVGDGSQLTNVSGSGLWVANSAGIHTTVDVGIGTTNPSAAVTVDNTAKLAVGIVSAYQLYGDGEGLTDVSWGSSQGGSFITEGSQTAVGGDPGDWQVIAGYWAGCCANSNTRYNVIFGKSAGRKLVDGERNVLIGDEVGCGLTTGMRNIFMGSSAACESTTGDYNIGLGYKTLRTSTGSCNIAIGFCAADGNTSGTNNVIIGKNANSDVGVGGTDNVWIGTDSGGYASGCCNTFVGAQSGYGVYNGTFNVGLGYQAGKSVIQQTAHYNVSIGAKAGLLGTTGSCNVFLGLCAGRAVSTGDFNLFAGHKAGDAVTVGACNVYLGNLAGAGSTAGERNIAVGQCAGYSNKTGSYNISFGSCAGYTNETGTDNVFIGRDAGKVSIASNNTFIGGLSGSKVTSGDSNIFLGPQSGQEATTSGCNIFIGRSAGQGDTGQPVIGGCNVALGAFAGRDLKDGTDNLFLGTRAGKANDDGHHNIFLGYYAGSNSGSGHCNVFIGSQAGNTNTTGNNNIAIGFDVELPNVSTNCQFAIGSGTDRWIAGDSNFNTTLAGIVTAYASGVLCATQFRGDGSCLTGAGGEHLIEGITVKDEGNVVGTAGSIRVLDFLGGTVTASGSGGDTASITIVGAGTTDGWTQDSQANLVAGNSAGSARNANTIYNVMIGCNAGRDLSSGDCNTFIGHNAGQKSVSNTLSVFIGRDAGQCRVDNQDYNIAIGYAAGSGSNKSNSNDNIAIGRLSGIWQDGNNNISMGLDAARCQTTGSNNISIGQCALIGSATTTANTAAGNIAIGCGAGLSVTAATNHVLIGTGAGQNASCAQGRNGVAIGYEAGCTQVCYDVFIGCGAGKSNVTGKYNVFLGSDVGPVVTDGTCNVMVGRLAGYCMTTGDKNIFLGLRAGQCATCSVSNVFIGEYAGFNVQNSTVGDTNVAIGYAAGYCIGTNARCNTLLGPFAGQELDAGCSNVIIGQGSGFNVSGGNANTFLGFYAGQNVTSGCNNIAIGRFVQVPSATGSNQFAIGCCTSHWITGDTNFNVGIGTNTTDAVGVGVTAKLSVGIVSAYQLYGDGTNLVGVAKSSVLQDAGIDPTGISTFAHLNITGISTFGANILVTGTASASDFNSTSDIRLKTNIKRIEDPLDKVVRIEGVTFDWKEWNRPALGVIADQVEKVIPELVQGTDPKTVNYNGLIGLLIEAVKEQQTQIDDLKGRLSKLE